MIFPKSFLAEQLESKVQSNYRKLQPFQTVHDENGIKNPLEFVVMNYHTSFDLKSNEMKDKVYNARKEIVDTCFNEADLGLTPNSLKIQECIKRINYKHYGNLFERREVYFGNSKFYINSVFHHYISSLKDIPQSNAGNLEKMNESTERYIWDSHKSKYYFKQKFNL
jgi:hypothetical protein